MLQTIKPIAGKHYTTRNNVATTRQLREYFNDSQIIYLAKKDNTPYAYHSPMHSNQIPTQIQDVTTNASFVDKCFTDSSSFRIIRAASEATKSLICSKSDDIFIESCFSAAYFVSVANNCNMFDRQSGFN
uniref:Uncharacterized protein n=1 Tax=Romanomermis culicivorax TaxID=13658 RepID=A0A915I0S8_ROMCU